MSNIKDVIAIVVAISGSLSTIGACVILVIATIWHFNLFIPTPVSLEFIAVLGAFLGFAGILTGVILGKGHRAK